MLTDDMVAAEGLVWHRTGQPDEAGHFLPPRGGIVALCKSSTAPLFFLTWCLHLLLEASNVLATEWPVKLS